MLALVFATQIMSVHVYGEGVERRQPHLTLEQAIADVSKLHGNTELHLMGRFRVTSPIQLSGVKNLTIVGDSDAEILGGPSIPAKAWKRTTFLGHDVLQAAYASSTPIHEVWADGVRLHPPLLPKKGYWNFSGFLDGSEKAEWNKGQTHMRFAPNTLADWHNLTDVELVAHHFWVTSRLPVKELKGDVVEFAKPSVFKLADDYTGVAAPFRAENVAEALSERDEFYFDRTTQTIYLPASAWPKPPKNLDVPIASQLLVIKGSENVRIRNVRFSNTEWCYPGPTSGDVQAAFSVPAAVEIGDSKNVTLDRCQLTHLGTYGLEIAKGSENCAIRSSDITDLGGGGVKIDTGSSHSTVENCRITGGGRLHAPAIGVWIADSGYNTVSRNLISDFYYTGISIGWVWGYGPSQGNHNVIERNVIHTIGQRELSDMGAIYNLGVSPGTVIRHNLIANVQSRGYGGWGIYLDEGSSDVLVEQNAVFGVRTGTFHQHYGKDNLIQHNLLCGAERDGQIIRSRPEDHVSFRLTENVVLWQGTNLFGGNLSGGNVVSERNLLARLDPGEDRPNFDVGSRKLDPKDAATVTQWLGAKPGSVKWWRSFGPTRGNWRKDIESYVSPWLKRLDERLR